MGMEGNNVPMGSSPFLQGKYPAILEPKGQPKRGMTLNELQWSGRQTSCLVGFSTLKRQEGEISDD